MAPTPIVVQGISLGDLENPVPIQALPYATMHALLTAALGWDYAAGVPRMISVSPTGQMTISYPTTDYQWDTASQALVNGVNTIKEFDFANGNIAQGYFLPTIAGNLKWQWSRLNTWAAGTYIEETPLGAAVTTAGAIVEAPKRARYGRLLYTISGTGAVSGQIGVEGRQL